MMLALILSSCITEEVIEERFYPRNDHEAYWYSLKQAGLLETALGEDWIMAAQRPFKEQIKIKLPYQESFNISNKLPDANGYRFGVKRGQEVQISIKLLTSDPTKLFIDLFRVRNDSLDEYDMVASADSSFSLAFQARRDASYLLRVQPELLRGGQFSITIESTPTLAFPVAGKDKRAIQSVFGDPRDGGRRKHHGVDIFAKRHTPILAPVDGIIRFVGTRGIGGKVVWMRNPKTGDNLYFAHLQDYQVERYQRVSAGDTIGTVGNTGNARTTPPHLHFGIYHNGPIDPYAFIVPDYDKTNFTVPDTTSLGHNLTVRNTLLLRSQMLSTHAILDTLHKGDIIAVEAINHQFVRVETQNNTEGFLRKKDVM